MTQQWKLVPVEPTPEMRDAFARVFHDNAQADTFGPAVVAMLEAAPTPPASAQDDAKDERTKVMEIIAGVWDHGTQIDDAADEVIELLRSNAPAAGDAREWEGLTKAELASYVGSIIEYGPEFVAPLYSVVESIEKRLRDKNAASQQQEG